MKKIIALLVFALFACVPAWSQDAMSMEPMGTGSQSAGPLLNGIRTPLILGGALGFGSGTGVGTERGIGLYQIEPMIGIWYPGLGVLDWPGIMAAVKAVPQELLLIFESAGFLQAGKRRISSRMILENGVNNAYFCENAAAIAQARRNFVLP